MTSVLGHLYESDFGTEHKKWKLPDIEKLFSAEVYSTVAEKMNTVAENIMNLARSASVLFIWTDCDSEGESIGYEIYKCCQKVNRSIILARARFSSLDSKDIINAWDNPKKVNMNEVSAVECRTEIDLKIGAAFTRLQTLVLQKRLDRSLLREGPVSYGSCQTPTLNFVVERYLDIRSFVSEPFHKLCLSIDDTKKIDFTWDRQHLFDKQMTVTLYEKCMDSPKVTVVSTKTKTIHKLEPLPLTTIQLQKMAVNNLKISSYDVMNIAESLYTKGYISYPRTETDSFPHDFKFQDLISLQAGGAPWSKYAKSLLDGKFVPPRKGKHSDDAHLPIYPISFVKGLSPNNQKVYELITRTFLACCSKKAVAEETVVKVSMNGETFTAKGLVVIEKNYLDVYPYEKWQTSILPPLKEGQILTASSLVMKSAKTKPPDLLSEAELISLMDKYHIGTDATIHEHIKKILDRLYANIEGKKKLFKPSDLGIALILSYRDIGLGSLTDPFLRGKMEENLKDIKLGKRYKYDVLNEVLGMYQKAYRKLSQNEDRFISVFVNSMKIPTVAKYTAPK